MSVNQDRAQMVTLQQAAAILGVTRELVRRRVDDGTIPAWHDALDGRAVLIAREDVDTLKQQRLTPMAGTKSGTKG